MGSGIAQVCAMAQFDATTLKGSEAAGKRRMIL
jgi:hypothetical protein